MEALVRRAVPEDAEAIAALHIRSWQFAYRGQLPDQYLDQLGEQVRQRSEFWRAHISSPPTNKNEVWVVGTETRMDAFAAIGPAREADPNVTGELYAIYVDPDRWGQGLGRTLLPVRPSASNLLDTRQQFFGCLHQMREPAAFMRSPDGPSTADLNWRAELALNCES
jgi:GNAT superfamily N-acetyltransferase